MQPPFFSIVIPTHGRIAALSRCLEALGRQDYPSERFEVIVVSDGDAPMPAPVVENLSIQVVAQPKSGPSAARNSGAIQARGDYLAFTDDDCIPTADWLSQLSAAFDHYPERMVGGRVVNALPENNYAAASQLLVDFLYERYNADPLQAQFFTANNLALRRDLFLEMGGFDIRFSLAAGEDRELCRRWIDKGYGMFYESAALVHHAHDLTLAGFWRQHVNYGRGAFRFRQQQNERRKLERPTFYTDLLRYPFRRANGPQAAHLFIRFLLMQVANTYGFIREKWESTAS
jgi:GT2 family glycosyltransferase